MHKFIKYFVLGIVSLFFYNENCCNEIQNNNFYNMVLPHISPSLYSSIERSKNIILQDDIFENARSNNRFFLYGSSQDVNFIVNEIGEELKAKMLYYSGEYFVKEDLNQSLKKIDSLFKNALEISKKNIVIIYLQGMDLTGICDNNKTESLINTLSYWIKKIHCNNIYIIISSKKKSRNTESLLDHGFDLENCFQIDYPNEIVREKHINYFVTTNKINSNEKLLKYFIKKTKNYNLHTMNLIFILINRMLDEESTNHLSENIIDKSIDIYIKDLSKYYQNSANENFNLLNSIYNLVLNKRFLILVSSIIIINKIRHAIK